jgi:hypothetical protein
MMAAPPVSAQQAGRDWVTDLPRENLQVKAWPGGKKVAVAFVLYVETWGKGHGPNLRPDMTSRDPDVVNGPFGNTRSNGGWRGSGACSGSSAYRSALR